VQGCGDGARRRRGSGRCATRAGNTIRPRGSALPATMRRHRPAGLCDSRALAAPSAVVECCQLLGLERRRVSYQGYQEA